MTVRRFFDEGTTPHVSTYAFHEHRDRAPHLEQEAHRDRLIAAADMVHHAVALAELTGLPATVSDLGCGDGGLLSLLNAGVKAWGYDFTPANAAGWRERLVCAYAVDVFADRDKVQFGTVTVMTEVLEHVADPAGVLAWIGSPYLICSSPWDETGDWHDECHAWAFDLDGYRELIETAGFTLLRHEKVGRFQLALGRRR
jgi:SAM-dependent methyltransferase